QDRVVPVPVSLCPDTPQPGHTQVPDAGPDPDPATDLGGHDHHGGDPIDTTTAGTPSGPGSGDNSSGSPSGQPSTPGQIPGTDVESNVAAAPGAPVSHPSGVRPALPAGSRSCHGTQSLL